MQASPGVVVSRRGETRHRQLGRGETRRRAEAAGEGLALAVAAGPAVRVEAWVEAWAVA
jgi:hypothetical protein